MADSDQISDHVESCEKCDHVLMQLENEQVEVLNGLKQELCLESLFREPEYQWLQNAVAMPQNATVEKEVDAIGNQENRFRDYRLVRKIGEGGMGTVYQAVHVHLGKQVAIKILPIDKLHSKQAVRRFRQEMRAVGSVNHPNIVDASDAGSAGGQHFLVMELVRGADLAQIVRLQGPLGVTDACEIVRQSALGLQHAHDNQLVHRDVKPSNVILGVDGRVKLLDLGLAGLNEPDAEPITKAAVADRLTSAGQIIGTLDYMAPEQIRSSRNVDGRADTYALGATLFHLLAGRTPCGNRSDDAKLRMEAVLHMPPRDVAEFRDDVPEKLCVLLQRMLAKDPAERPQRISEVSDALAGFSDGANLVSLADNCSTSLDDPPADLSVMDDDSIRSSLEASRDSSRGIFNSRHKLIPAITCFLLTILASVVYYIQSNNGTVRVEVVDESLQVTISGLTVTAKEADAEPITIRAGQGTLIVRQGDKRLLTDRFVIKRNQQIRFKVELFDQKLVVLQDGNKYRSLPLPIIKPDDPSSLAAFDDTSASNSDTSLAVHFDDVATVEEVSAEAFVDGCVISGSFTPQHAVMSLRNPMKRSQTVTYNYQILLVDGHETRYTPGSVIFKSGKASVLLKAGQSRDEIVPLVADSGVSLNLQNRYDIAEIRVAKKPLPLNISNDRFIPRPESVTKVADRAVTIAIWEYRNVVPLVDDEKKLETATEVDLHFRKVVSAPLQGAGSLEARRLSLSDDFKYLAAGYRGSSFQIWDVEKDKPATNVIDLRGACYELGFARDSSIAWCIDYGGVLRLVNAETGSQIREEKGELREGFSGELPKFSPDGTVMASNSRSGHLEFWNVKENTLIKEHQLDDIQTIRFSDDGRYCFTWKNERDARGRFNLYVWDANTGEPIVGPIRDDRFVEAKMNVGRPVFINDMYSAKQNQIFTFANLEDSDRDELLVRATDQEDWPVVRRIALPCRVGNVHWIDNGHLLIEGRRKAEDSGRKERLLIKVPVDGASSEIEVVSPKGFRPYRFVYDQPGQRWLDVHKNSVACWSLRDQRLIWKKDIPPIDWRARGLIGKEGWVLVHGLQGPAFVFDLDDGEELWRQNETYWAEAKGSNIVVGNREGAEVWCYQSQQESTDETVHSDIRVLAPQTSVRLPHVRSTVLEVSADGRKVFANNVDWISSLWDPVKGERKFSFLHDQSITCVTAARDGSRVVTTSHDGTAKIWNAKTGALVAKLEGHDDKIWHATHSPSGKYLFTGSGPNRNTGRIWNAKSGQLVVELVGHTDKVVHAQFNQDESRVLTGSWDNTVRLWDVADGKPLHAFEHGSSATAQFSGDEKSILTIANGMRSFYWTLDGRRANEGYSPLGKPTVAVWDVESGEQRFELEHSAPVAASYSSDFRQIVSVSGKQILFWDAATGKHLKSLTSNGVHGMHTEFSPDRRYVTIFDKGKSATLWNIPEQKPRLKLVTGDASANAFSPDSLRYYSLSRRGTLRSWFFD